MITHDSIVTKLMRVYIIYYVLVSFNVVVLYYSIMYNSYIR
jgi:hypothetical protein